jgi:hypothetical protein
MHRPKPKPTQGALTVFGIACLATGVWGMYTVPKDLAGQAWGVMDNVQVGSARAAFYLPCLHPILQL